MFVITEDGYFRCLYLDEVMGYQNKLSEQRAAAGSKGGRSSKKKTVQTAEKVITSTVLTAADKEANDDADNKENNSNKEKEITVVAVVELFKNIGFAPRQKRYINEIFPIRVRVDTPRTIPDLEERGVGPPMDKCISYLC